ncbi:prolyl oligopeptidase family serine peptidase [Nigerium massiliense]|uniref:prolyl oligopeptidase family serine peptidase n=1 Tax=Nigerium massiliense TaxID=1522317 RepID=UPI00058CABF1|nr:prolyl oligopeptidase family serine peptidase [Nigerium massiliense]
MIEYPTTRRDEVVEDHFGHEVADPYRWLEDADAAETAAWVKQQQEFTESELARLPERAWFAEELARIVGRCRAGVPRARGGRYFVSRNDGEQAQDVWFVADTLADLISGGTVVLDPNTWSADGADSLGFFTVSDDGRHLAYGVSEGGSDWRKIRLLDLETGRRVDEPDVVGRFTLATWLPDNASYLYATYDEASDARGTATRGLGAAKLMRHRLGSTGDDVVLTFPDDPHLMTSVEVTHDGRWLIASIVSGTENRNRVWVYPLGTDGGETTIGEPLRLIDEAVAEWSFVRADGDRLLFTTDLDAPRGRLVALDLAAARTGAPVLTEVAPETADTLIGAASSPDVLYLAYLSDALTRVRQRGLDGRDLGDLELPAGSLTTLDASPKRPDVFCGLSTIDAPTRAFEIAGGRAIPLALTGDEGARLAPPFSIERRRATSKDGTRVPYFVIRAVPEASDAPDALDVEEVEGPESEAVREETPLDSGEPEGPPVLTAVAPDGAPEAEALAGTVTGAVQEGPRPTLLYGYGGFKIPVLPDYRPGWPAWLKAGGVLVLANLRGGGEFGTDWYDDGRLANKQHVFDDAIAVAEDLIETGVTTPGHLAVHGRSNGGLLAGALLTQRPDLISAALPSVGVLDLLRFHLFTIGSAWISDYGDPGTKEGFEAAYMYSPLHNVDPGLRYPATLISTADHDDRVVPAHSFKFAAALQAAQAGDAPILLRVDSAAGHGAGKPLDQIAAEWADVLAFAAHHTHLQVPPR